MLASSLIREDPPAIAGSPSLEEDGSDSSIETSLQKEGESQILVPWKRLLDQQQKLKLEQAFITGFGFTSASHSQVGGIEHMCAVVNMK